MRVVVKEDWIKKRAGAAQYASRAGAVLMLAGVAMAFIPRYVIAAYALLLISLPLLGWGARRGEKWLSNPRPDQVVAKALKSLDHKYQLYSFVLPAELALLGPAGVFALLVKTQDGRISCRGDKWHRQFTWRRFWLSLYEDPLGNPSKQARSQAERLRRFVAERLPNVNVPVQPVVVFINSNAELNVMEPTVPAMPLGALRAHLRSAGGALPQATYQALAALFDEQSS